jgi:hypothetical protein
MNPSNEILAILFTGTISLAALAFIALDVVPAETIEHPDGLSVRNESQSHGHFFVGYHSRRTHLGGGLFGGK